MKTILKLLAVASLFGLAACPGGDNGSSSSGNTTSSAVNNQGPAFAKDYNAPNNSQPSAVNPGDAGPANLTAQPNKVM